MAGSEVLGLSFASLAVRDLEKSKTFFEKILGFQVAPIARPNAVVMHAEENLGAFALRWMPDLVTPGAIENCGIAIWFRCKDVDALELRVREAGAIVVSPAQDGPFGRMVVIREPDGRNITFHSA
jgi:predicted enzyme related to lactoylglutathione lyase